MKHLLVVTIIVGCWASAEAQHWKRAKPFPLGTYDYYGYAAWGELGPVSDACWKGLNQMKTGDYKSAWATFKTAHEKRPSDLTVIQGWCQCARVSRRLTELLNILATEASVDLKQRQDPPSPIILGYQYALGMVAAEFNDGNRKDQPEVAQATTPLGFYYGRLHDNPSAFVPSNRINAIMYVSAKWAGGEVGGARRAARKALASDPDFYQLRAVLADGLELGVLAYMVGSTPKPVPPDDKADFASGLREAETIVRQVPSWPTGYYLAGVYAAHFDRAKAKAYFRKYLAIAPKGTPRYEYAKQQINKP